MRSDNDNKLPKDVVADKQRTESRAMNKQRRRIAKRSNMGADWDGSAANDNLAWPLAKALLSEGNTELLKYAFYYRKVHDTAMSGALLGGSSVAIGEGFSLDQRQWIKPNGEIAYKGVRVVAKGEQEFPSRRKVPPYVTDEDNGVEKNWSNVPKPWNGDSAVNGKIDAQDKLIRLRISLGHLCEPFEMACIDGKTLAEVGNAAGIANRSGAQGAGRALVHTALVTIRDYVGNVRRRDIAA